MYVRSSRTRIEIWTPAKLNLHLEVLGRRLDGFHEIETLMVPISLYDTLRLEARDDDRLLLAARWDLGADLGETRGAGGVDAAFGDLPTDGTNLVLRALELLRCRARERTANEATPRSWGANAELIKRIPSAAGLGGGSSDAAAALLAANQVWNLGWTLEQLAEVAAELGSDIPFFLAGGPAVCDGRGERVRPLAMGPRLHLVIVRPAEGLSTAAVYRNTVLPGQPRRMAELLAAWDSCRPSRIGPSMFNRLQEAGAKLSSCLEPVRRAFDRLDVLGHQMSGSGSCYFGVCRDARHAGRVAAVLKARRVGRVFRAVSLVPGQQVTALASVQG
jgi:4-diphosphocytidyl-2-C-methyl-D-erythritol kinase